MNILTASTPPKTGTIQFFAKIFRSIGAKSQKLDRNYGLRKHLFFDFQTIFRIYGCWVWGQISDIRFGPKFPRFFSMSKKSKKNVFL